MRILKILVLFTALLVVSGVNITYTYQSIIREMNKNSKSFYSETALFFVADDNELTYNKLVELLPPDSTFYSNYVADYDVRGIFFNGKFKAPKMQSGRFFSIGDFAENKKIAVVGKGVKTYRKDGHIIYKWDDNEYKVIGTMGYHYPTRLDTMVMLAINNELIEQEVYRYIIESDNYQANFDFLGNENVFGEVIIYDSNELDLLRTIDGSTSQFVIAILLIALLIVNVLLINFYLIDGMTYELRIKKMVGYNKTDLVIDKVKELNIWILAGVLCGSLLSLIYSMKNFGEFSAIIILIDLCLYIFINGYISLLVYFKTNNLTIVKQESES